MDEDEYRDKLIGALQFIAGGQISGPSGLEGLAMAIAGEDFNGRGQSLAGAVYAVAAALDRIADAIEADK